MRFKREHSRQSESHNAGTFSLLEHKIQHAREESRQRFGFLRDGPVHRTREFGEGSTVILNLLP